EPGKVLLYDMTDPSWRMVRLSQDGWEITKQTAPIFRRFNGKAQVEPSRAYDPKIFDKYLDLYHVYGEDKRLLQKVWIVTAFIPSIPHIIDMIHGEQGGIKSDYAKSRKELIDH